MFHAAAGRHINRIFIHRKELSSSIKTLSFNYASEGPCSIAVPLPLQGYDENRLFCVTPLDPLENLPKSIMKESEGVTSASIEPASATKFTWNDVFGRDDIKLLVNGNPLHIQFPLFVGNLAEKSLEEDRKLEVGSLLNKVGVLKVRSRLSSLHTSQITFEKYLEICEECGISELQGKELSRCLHQVGEIFHFDEPNELSGVMFLRPTAVLDTLLTKMQLSSFTFHNINKEQRVLHRRIARIEPEVEVMTNLKKELDTTAQRFARSVCYTASAGLLGCFGVYWWLSFVYLSWDIMEPVTYFTGFGVYIFAYLWWSITNSEYEYENVYDFVRQRKQIQLYKRRQLDIGHWEDMLDRLDQYKGRLAHLEKLKKEPSVLQSTLWQKYLNMHDQDEDELKILAN